MQTLGKAAAAFLLPPLLGGSIAALTGKWGWAAFGSLVGVVVFVIYLSSVVAPMPTDDVISLALDDEEAEVGGMPADPPTQAN